MDECYVGANLPWLDYGQDFGRAGLRLDASGHPLGLDERFFPDLDAALAALREGGLASARWRSLLDGLPQVTGHVKTARLHA